VLARNLAKAGITTFDALERIGNVGVTINDLHYKDPRRIELICNRHPPFGNDILEAVKKLPRYSMELFQVIHGNVLPPYRRRNHQDKNLPKLT
jgi:ATP-dependent DNA helicase HFM1/MER3